MPILDSAAIIEACAAGVDSRLFTSLVRQESNFNPYAIGLDGKAVLKAQPRSYEEAVKTAVNLMRQGKGFSVGLSQVHISNVVRFKMTWQEAFDPCTNLRTGSEIFRGFYARAVQAGYRGQDALFATLRGFNSGSVHNPVSDGYAKAILGRVGVAPAASSPSIASVPSLPAAMKPAASAVAQDVSSPDMFAAPSPSLFGERHDDRRKQPESPNVTVADVSQEGARPPIEADAVPVVLRASVVP
ncbi:transglycosylase SLT domain-containing protein [Burkholderia multivorans]|uniref:transglycosylase SLT domain-containing protein n=1 Tax=Burkholderia multivorans TaxID=87883 RepID=UPI0009B9012D|nr:transglycosylase SLT domain-containing protein [Burkholderia multivorans]MDR9230058.1 Type IV secretion system protein virB1 [Burkholderia multivorans]HDR9474424.1 transglycosylase SLT domain-containing protein [Burkholderia multivorans]HDR9480266.1 transglycosylase SLT domain-containing protein [Burkholderia multivorans]